MSGLILFLKIGHYGTSGFPTWWQHSLKKHRNGCIFNGESPSVSTIIRAISEEAALWSTAGAKELRRLACVR
ncbi:hypothetical protein DAI22_11g064500 [Oryza sativa Japonica Group]|nr:hypothetical protein DAI22_11g064500 [Oryza sativa Japonica Group]